jgi:hypothetical protein
MPQVCDGSIAGNLADGSKNGRRLKAFDTLFSEHEFRMILSRERALVPSKYILLVDAGQASQCRFGLWRCRGIFLGAAQQYEVCALDYVGG